MPQALRIPPAPESFTAWPPSPCGRLSRPPRRGVTPATATGPVSPGDSHPAGDPAFVPVLRASATQAPRSSPWMPSLGIAPALKVRPHPTPCGRSAGPRFHASFRQGQGFTPAGDQGSGNPALAISRGSPQRAARTHRHGRWFPGHALVPFTFQIQVSHQTQEYPPNPSRLHREYDRAPRGAGWSLVWSWFCRIPHGAMRSDRIRAVGMEAEGADCRKQIGLLCTAAARGPWQG